jgi:hypothetical protein
LTGVGSGGGGGGRNKEFIIRKKLGASFQRTAELFLLKHLSLNFKKYGVGIRNPEKSIFWILDSGPGSKRHWIPDPDPQHR